MGLIGGSLALALKAHGWEGEIYAFDLDRDSLMEALEAGAIDRAANDVEELASSADFIVIAVPVRSIIPVLKAIAPRLYNGSLVIDVGSAKGNIVRVAGEVMPPGVTFVGGHPMAGSERRGFGNADPELFRDAAFIFTPLPDCPSEIFTFLTQAFTGLGARVMFMDADVHDHAVSMVSHLPHILAFALVNMAIDGSREVKGMAQMVSGGFRDMTRIASSDVSLWVDIMMENSAEIGLTLRRFIGMLEAVRDDLEKGDESSLEDMMRRAKNGKISMFAALAGGIESLYALTVPVENKPGVVYRVTQALGERGINLEDLEISHSLEGGRGLLKLYVRGESIAERSKEILRSCGFSAGVEKAVELS